MHARQFQVGLRFGLSLLIALAALKADAQTPTPTPTPQWQRWFELQTAQWRVRYHSRIDSADRQVTDAIQYKQAYQGRLKFDAQTRYSLTALVATGSRFTVGWNNFSYGTGQFAANLYLKHLFFTAQPVKGVEYSVGGFDVMREQATEITTYNNDAFMTGQRLVVRRPKELWFDEVAVTYGYLGDFNRANLNKRYHHLKQGNYAQWLVGKTLNKRVAFSADLTATAGARTLHEAVKFKPPDNRWLSSVTLEAYQRVSVRPERRQKTGNGFALHGDKTLLKRFTVGGGFTQIDPQLPLLNADRVFTGKHLFTNNTVTLTPELAMFVFLSRRVATPFAVPVKTRFEIGLNFNLLKALQKSGWFL